MTQKNEKILAIQFQYLGDIIFLLPALKALKIKFPKAELHVLVAKEMKDLLNHVSFIDRLWIVSRVRGKINFFTNLPLILRLRRESFTRSVDFGGNDRGAIYSFLSGAKIRLGMINKPIHILHNLCYNQKIAASNLSKVYIQKNLDLLNLWDIDAPSKSVPKIDFDKSHLAEAKKLLKGTVILCHIGTSQLKKEWPIYRWLELNKLFKRAGLKVVYTSGVSLRERSLLDQLKSKDKLIHTLEPTKNLNVFLAVLSLTKVVVSGDTGPLHFANALGTKIVGLYAVEGSVVHAAPNYKSNQKIIGSKCTCTKSLQHYETCQSSVSCMSSIQPVNVFKRVKFLLS
jgi:ADP-heptose:LPS heptosyltransferase